MNKAELIKAVAIGAGVTHAQAAKMLDALQETVANVLRYGGKISIRGFGTFTISDRCARVYHHPKANEKRMAPAYRTVRFIPSQQVKSSLN